MMGLEMSLVLHEMATFCLSQDQHANVFNSKPKIFVLHAILFWSKKEDYLFLKTLRKRIYIRQSQYMDASSNTGVVI